jgi:hypothetical protein
MTAMPTDLPHRLMQARRARISPRAIANTVIVATALVLLTWTIVTIKRDLDGAHFGPNPYHGAQFGAHRGS